MIINRLKKVDLDKLNLKSKSAKDKKIELKRILKYASVSANSQNLTSLGNVVGRYYKFKDIVKNSKIQKSKGISREKRELNKQEQEREVIRIKVLKREIRKVKTEIEANGK